MKYSRNARQFTNHHHHCRYYHYHHCQWHSRDKCRLIYASNAYMRLFSVIHLDKIPRNQITNYFTRKMIIGFVRDVKECYSNWNELYVCMCDAYCAYQPYNRRLRYSVVINVFRICIHLHPHYHHIRNHIISLLNVRECQTMKQKAIFYDSNQITYCNLVESFTDSFEYAHYSIGAWTTAFSIQNFILLKVRSTNR